MSKISEAESSVPTEDFVNAFNRHSTHDFDQESVQTGEFEQRFKSLMIPSDHNAGMREIRTGAADHDDKSRRLKQKIGNILHVPADEVQFSMSQKETDEINKKYDEIVKRDKSSVGASRLNQNGLTATISPNVNLNNEINQRSESIRREIEQERRGRQKRFDIDSESVSMMTGDIYNTNHGGPVNTLAQLQDYDEDTLQNEVPMNQDGAGNGGVGARGLDEQIIQLDQLTSTVRQATREREKLSSELTDLRSRTGSAAADLQIGQRQLAETTEKLGKSRLDLERVERDRSTAIGQLAGLEAALEQRRRALNDLNNQIGTAEMEIKRVRGQKLERENELLNKVVAERDELIQMVRNQEEAEEVAFELEKRLGLAESELKSERERAVTERCEMEAELKRISIRNGELQSENCCLADQLETLECRAEAAQHEVSRSARDVEYLKNDFENQIQYKLEEYEKNKQIVIEDLENIKSQKSAELRDLKEYCESLFSKLCEREKELGYEQESLSNERIKNDELIAKLKHLEHIIEQKTSNMKETQARMEMEMNQVKRELQNENETAQSEQRRQFDIERQRLEQTYCSNLDDLKCQLCSREEQLKLTTDRICQLEKDGREQLMRANEEAHAALQHERNRTEKECSIVFEEQLEREKQNWDDVEMNLTKKMEQLQTRLERERQTNLELSTKLEEERQKSQKAFNEKIAAIKKIKEICQKNSDENIKSVQAKLERSVESEMITLQQSIKSKSSQLESAHRDKEKLLNKVDELRAVLEKICVTVVKELNEECRHLARSLNVSPRTVEISAVARENNEVQNKQDKNEINANSLKYLTNLEHHPVTLSLANLRACREEIQNQCGQLLRKCRHQLETAKTMKLSHKDELVKLRLNCIQQKDREVNEIRRKLLKQRLNETKVPLTSRSKSSAAAETENFLKEQMAQHMAEKLDKCIRREYENKIERLSNSLNAKERELNVLKNSLNPAAKAVGNVTSSVETISRLQEKIKSLRQENLMIRKGEGNFIHSSRPNYKRSTKESQRRQRSLDRMCRC